MQCNTMRPETRSISRTSPSSPTSPLLPTVAAQVMLWAAPEGQGEGTSWPHNHYHSNLFSIIYTCWCPIYLTPLLQKWLLPSPNKCPAQGQTCCACSDLHHYTDLCNWKKTQQQSHNTPQRGDRNPRGSRSPRQASSPGSTYGLST